MKTLLSLWITLTFIVTLFAADQHIHVHGKADGSIIIEEQSISIELTIPALSIVGFEHQPKSKEEKQRIKDAMKILQSPDLFTFFKDTGWFRNDQKVPVTILKNTIEVVKDIDKDDKDNNSNHKESQNTHMEFTVQLHYKLEADTTINSVSTTLLSRIPDLHELNLIVIAGEHQIHYELAYNKSKINIKGEK